MTTEPFTDYAEVFEADDGLWYWHVKAANHEIIAQSEGYVNRGDAISVLEQHFPDVAGRIEGGE